MKKIYFILLVIIPFINSCIFDEGWDPNNYKVIVLDGNNVAYHFKTGLYYGYSNLPDDIDQNGMINEPWCTELPGLCGNYLITDKSSFADFDAIPTGTFENYCDQMPLNKVIVFKLDDDSYAFVKIVDDQYSQSDNGCEHRVTLHVGYPVEFATNNVGIDEDDFDEFESTFEEDNYININPTDPEFIRIKTEEGNIINVFGERDEQGLPLRARYIKIQSANGEKTKLHYNEDGFLEQAVADNGTIFNYEELVNGLVGINIETSDGTEEFYFVVDPYADDNAGLGINTSIPSATFAEHFDPCNGIVHLPLNEDVELKSADVTSGSVNHVLFASRCGKPSVMPIESVFLMDKTGKEKKKELYASETNTPGTYNIVAPDAYEEIASTDPSLIAEKLVTVLDKYCEYFGELGSNGQNAIYCSAISVQLAAMTGIGVVASPGIITACASISGALDIYCNMVSGDGVPGTNSFLQEYIDRMKQNNLWYNFVALEDEMQIRVKFQGVADLVNVKGSLVHYFPVESGNSAIMNVDLSPPASIKNLRTDPVQPSATAGYNVSARVYCVPVGSTIMFSGTDANGWMDQMMYEVNTSAEGAGDYIWSIAGREYREYDIIKVTITEPDGNVTSKQTVIHFEEEEVPETVFKEYKYFHFEFDPKNKDGLTFWDQEEDHFGSLDLSWPGPNEFTNNNYYKVDGSDYVKINLNGTIGYNASGTPLLNAVYVLDVGNTSYNVKWVYTITIKNLPAASITDDVAAFNIDQSTPALQQNMSNYISYSYSFDDFISGSGKIAEGANDFGSGPIFHFEFREQ